ncbi:OLC1v1030430C1 [Oldenlandia corymbosa var. corymbosa]|uniref:OLC1v1030430C1 n=1 Tax=Oldenlandia corymbosa var. corymbosa TaxID=529605 RepID=A0AAV1CHM1_OLDCO|nr:OLC1v1030430C1 [Oldenlandia corymbosa var. corymbosa]
MLLSRIVQNSWQGRSCVTMVQILPVLHMGSIGDKSAKSVLWNSSVQKMSNLLARLGTDEAINLIRSIKPLAGHSTLVILTEKLAEYTNSMVVRAAFGKVVKIKLVKESTPLCSAFEISDLFPSLKILHPFFSNKTKLMEIHHKLDKVLDNIIDQYLDEDLDNVKAVTYVSPINIISLLWGTETSSSTVEWAMAELIGHPEVMSKLQNEIRMAFKEKETIEEDDIQELRYLQSVIKEILRLHPPLPFLVPRERREQTEIDGYIIPVKTHVFVNVWTIARDSEYWDDPESFKPEGFDESDKDFAGNHFEYIPFGAGRRICPGISFGLANVYLPLALLLYHFDWELPGGMNPKDLDMGDDDAWNCTSGLVVDLLSESPAMSLSKNTIGLFGDAKIFDIKNSDDEGSSTKVSKKRKLRRLVKASEAGAKLKKKKKQTPAVEKEGPTEEVTPVEEDRPVEDNIPIEENRPVEEGAPVEGDKTIGSSRKDAAENPDASPGSSFYTAAAAIFHFGDDRIECPIIKEVAETMTDEEALKMLRTSLASILMRKKNLSEEISSLELKKGFLEHEKAIYEEARKKEQLIRAAKEEELATA